MDFFFHPKGIALIGASPSPEKGGNTMLKNLQSGFEGPVYPVNPRYQEIEGLPCFASILEVPDPIDFAIIFVPFQYVLQAVDDCIQRGLPGVIIEAAGFAEAGPEGKRIQEQLKERAVNSEIRIWGPNCMGYVDIPRRYFFSFISEKTWQKNLREGHVSVIVQSGLIGSVFLIDLMSHGLLGMNKACSIGNKVDVNECDVLEYLLRDPQTHAVGIYLETFSDGRRFLELCRQTTKPVVVLKGGKSKQGAAAAMSHTASLAGNAAVVSGALAQFGIVEAQDFTQMMDLCRTLATFYSTGPLPCRNVAVMTYSGAAGIVSADFMETMQLQVAELTESTLDRLKTVFPQWMPVKNPIDLWPAIEQHGVKRVYETTMQALCSDPHIEAIVLHVCSDNHSSDFSLASLGQMARHAHKPVFCWLLGSREYLSDYQEEAQSSGMHVFRELFRTLECLNTVSIGQLPAKDTHFSLDITAATHKPPQAATEILASENGILDEYLSKRVLRSYGIPCVQEGLVSTLDEAISTAGVYGYPVVLKGLSTEIVHKTEAGLVLTHLYSQEDIERGLETLAMASDSREICLLQKQVPGETELILGGLRDPQFGPCVMLGLGGTMAEVFQETVFAIAPLSPKEARGLISRFPRQQILQGFRDKPGVNKEILADILISLGNLLCDFPCIGEIDINPLIIAHGEPTVVDASIILSREV
jgi:acetyltransferase